MKKFFFFTCFFVFLFSFASAHLVGGSGFESGISHPLLGFDHLLAMVAVGVISTQVKGKGLWVVPGVFVSFMVLGGALGLLGVKLPIVEAGIMISLLTFGIIITLSKKISLKWAIAVVALFAVFHGHAHGEEMPAIANPVLYSLGFVLSTTVFHILGVVVGHYSKKNALSLLFVRFSGIGMSTVAFVLLVL